MVRLGRIRSKTPPPQQHDDALASGLGISRAYTNDNMSYITDVSSVTCPIELARSNSQESAGDADVSYFSMTEVNSALTGWTSVGSKSKEVIDSAAKLAPICEPQSSMDELSIVMDSSDDGSVEVQSITGKLKSMNAENWTPRPTSVQATRANKHKTPASPRPPLPPSPKTTGIKAVQFQSPSSNSQDKKAFFQESKPQQEKPTSPKSALKSKSQPPPPSPSSSSISSSQRKRQAVPPLKDPTMDDNEEDGAWEADCNYDINPTLMFQLLEGGDWKQCIDFLDGKNIDHDLWSFLTKGIHNKQPDSNNLVNELKARQKELHSQARTWIVRREQRSGILRWRMLPLHAALVFNAPFDVVLRLYHLYPGAMRCRNDLGMLPLHHVFMYGCEDRILELFLDVFPEGLGVVDDKGRLPLGCTPQDGSDNERRSNILDLYSKFQVEFATRALEEEKKKKKEGSSGRGRSLERKTADQPVYGQPHGKQTGNQQRQPMQPLQNAVPSAQPVASLGIAPRYTQTTDFNHIPYEAMRAEKSKDPTIAVRPIKASRRDIDDDQSLTDKYASMSDESASENSSNLANIRNERAHLRSELMKLGGLDTIDENGAGGKGHGGVTKVRKGLKKWFKRNTLASI